MQKELIEQWSRLAQTAFDSFKELSEINSRVVERLSQQNYELLNTYFLAGIKGVQLVAEPKSYQDLVAGQSALVAEYGDKLTAASRKTVDVLGESRNEYTAWVEKGVQTAQAAAPYTRPANSKKAA